MCTTWWDKNISNPGNYMRGHGDAVGVSSRDWLLTVIRDGESMLDVGCGPAVEYENLQCHNRKIEYKGIDFTQSFIDASRELFPEGNFQLGDARHLDEPDNSWDTVLLRHVIEHTPGYHDPIYEALRVARRRVVIVKWRPLWAQQDRIESLGDDGYCSDYNGDEFRSFIRSFKRPILHVEFRNQKPHPNYAWVIYKIQDDCVFDLDDFCDDADNANELFLLKEQFPNLKVTLFAIPSQTTPSRWRRYDWIELAAHGWFHDSNWECHGWTAERTQRMIDDAEAMGFVHGFKAPGWQLNNTVMETLAHNGWWAALQPINRPAARDLWLPAYYAGDNPWSVHGHMQNINMQEWEYRNGLLQLINERGLPWDDKTSFHFVSDVVATG